MTIKRLLPFIALLLLAAPAGASIALFVDGRAMKISGYKVVNESEVQLTLKSGGAITVPLTRVDRILDDEIVPAAIVEEVKKAVEKDGGIFPTRSWRYDEARGNRSSNRSSTASSSKRRRSSTSMPRWSPR